MTELEWLLRECEQQYVTKQKCEMQHVFAPSAVSSVCFKFKDKIIKVSGKALRVQVSRA
jgi:hypothetical protein